LGNKEKGGRGRKREREREKERGGEGEKQGGKRMSRLKLEHVF
jgi:hypothetical protein